MPFAGTPHPKPILGIVGGIGAGKSFVARTLAELGCAVIDSDAVAHAIYEDPNVLNTLIDWFGGEVVDFEGKVNRKLIAARVFNKPSDRKRLEKLMHPKINALREAEMKRLATDPNVRAFVWDSPLLIEAGLHTQCDAILFVDTPLEERLRRVASRHWDEAELARREASQVSLDQKRQLATHIVPGDATADVLRAECAKVLDAVAARAG